MVSFVVFGQSHLSSRGSLIESTILQCNKGKIILFWGQALWFNQLYGNIRKVGSLAFEDRGSLIELTKWQCNKGSITLWRVLAGMRQISDCILKSLQMVKQLLDKWKALAIAQKYKNSCLLWLKGHWTSITSISLYLIL